jgi:hypothetical protein
MAAKNSQTTWIPDQCSNCKSSLELRGGQKWSDNSYYGSLICPEMECPYVRSKLYVQFFSSRDYNVYLSTLFSFFLTIPMLYHMRRRRCHRCRSGPLRRMLRHRRGHTKRRLTPLRYLSWHRKGQLGIMRGVNHRGLYWILRGRAPSCIRLRSGLKWSRGRSHVDGRVTVSDCSWW